MYQATGLSQSISAIILIIQGLMGWHVSGYRNGMETLNESLKLKIEFLERQEIINALRECNWVMARAAKKLGITERMIGYKINKYSLRIKEVRWSDGAAEEREDNQEQKKSH
jgi:DNA-binding NtrC family response regulator